MKRSRAVKTAHVQDKQTQRVAIRTICFEFEITEQTGRLCAQVTSVCERQKSATQLAAVSGRVCAGLKALYTRGSHCLCSTLITNITRCSDTSEGKCGSREQITGTIRTRRHNFHLNVWLLFKEWGLCRTELEGVFPLTSGQVLKLLSAYQISKNIHIAANLYPYRVIVY